MTSTFVINCLVVIGAVLTIPLCFLNDPEVVTLEELPVEVRAWEARGQYTRVYNRSVFYIHERRTTPATGDNNDAVTFALVHGFPTSSFDYHRVIDQLLMHGDVIVHDHVGFGFSEKPQTDFTFSMSELAEHTLELWRLSGVKGRVKIVAHDMGDSVVCEILARRLRKQLPAYFDGDRGFAIAGVTFTNGGMNYARANLRIGQIILSSPWLGAYFNRISVRSRLGDYIAPKQIASIFSPLANRTEMRTDVEVIVALNKLNGGYLMYDKLIYYLHDRINFEFRWYPALQHEREIPIKLVWGDSDSVAPMKIPLFIETLNPKQIQLRVISGSGHFTMLESPAKWLHHVIN